MAEKGFVRIHISVCVSVLVLVEQDYELQGGEPAEFHKKK